MMTGTIYRWHNNCTGMVYIGQTKRPIHERKKEYYTEKSNRAIIVALNEYGHKNFTFEVLEKCPKEQLDQLEREHILIHHYWNKDCGYNTDFGGQKNRSSRCSILIKNIEELIRNNESEKIMDTLSDAKNINKPAKREKYKTIPNVNKDESTDIKLLMSLISMFSHYAVHEIFNLPVDTWVSFASFEIYDAHTFQKNKNRAVELIYEKGWWKKIKETDFIEESIMNYTYDPKHPASGSRKITWTDDDHKESAFQFFDINKFYLQLNQ
jgi:group I intron endonuclease